MFYTARLRTINLFASFLEYHTTNGAGFSLNSLSFCSPAISDGARVTSQGFTRRFCSTIYTLFGVFTRCSKFSAVNLFVTGNTQGYPVCDIQGKFGIFCKGFDVMSVDITPRFFAPLAYIVIALIYGDSPLGKLVTEFSSFRASCIAVLVGISPLARSGFTGTGLRTKNLSVVVGFKRLRTKGARFLSGWASVHPAIPRAILRGFRAVSFNLKRFAADYTLLSYLSIFHKVIIPQMMRNDKCYRAIDPGYCAVSIQRWVDLTGQQPRLISG